MTFSVLRRTEVNYYTRNNEIYKLWVKSVDQALYGCNICG